MLPARIGQIADWLQNVLPQPTAVSSAVPLEGVAYDSRIARVQARVAGTQRSLIVKILPEAQSNLALGHMFGLYAREVMFYNTIATYCGSAVPACYFASTQDHPYGAAIVLEEIPLSPTDLSSLTIAESRIADIVDGMASLHRRLEGRLPEFEWLPGWHKPEIVAIVAGAYAAGLPVFHSRFPDLLGRFERELGSRLGVHLAYLMSELGRGSRSVVHGDCRFGNILCRDSGAIVFIDWQLVCQGPPVFDIAYLLATSVEPEINRRERDQVLRRYRQASSEGSEKTRNGAALQREFLLSTLYCWVYCVIAFGALDLASDEERRAAHAIVRRCSFAIKDADALSLMPA